MTARCALTAAVPLLAALVTGCVAGGGVVKDAPRLPVLAVDPLLRGTVVESHADVLPHWLAQGISGATVVNVDAVGGLADVRPDKLAALREVSGRGDAAALSAAGHAGEAGLFHDWSFLRAAAGLGVVREVLWIIPFAPPAEGESDEGFRAFLSAEGLSPEEAAAFTRKDGCYRGAAGTLPVTVCGRDRLPVLDSPVVLSLGAGYFPAAAELGGHPVVTGVRLLFTALRTARYAVRDAAVVSSMQSEQWPVELRWVGEVVLEALRDPSLALAEEPPERWKELERLWALERGGAAAEGELLDLSLSLLQAGPHDAPLLLFAAVASAAHGGGKASLSYAEQACVVDPGYCVGLRELGLRYFDRGDFEAGGRFLAAAERRRPGMTYRQWDVGVALWVAGRGTEAVEALAKVVSREGAFPAGFVVGAMQAGLGDRAAARRSFDDAVAALGQAGQVAVTRKEVGDAVVRAAAFYREEGLAAQAERLESDARLRWVPPPAPGPAPEPAPVPVPVPVPVTAPVTAPGPAPVPAAPAPAPAP